MTLELFVNVSIYIFLFAGILLIIRIYSMKNKYYVGKDKKEFKENELITSEGNSIQYLNSLESNEVIDEYTLVFKKNKTVMKYQLKDDVSQDQVIEIREFTKVKKYKRSLFVSCCEHPIELLSKTKYVNIYTLESPDYFKMHLSEYDNKYRDYKKTVILESVGLFFLLMTLSGWILELLSPLLYALIQNINTLLMLFGLVIPLCFLNYRTLLKDFKRNNTVGVDIDG